MRQIHQFYSLYQNLELEQINLIPTQLQHSKAMSNLDINPEMSASENLSQLHMKNTLSSSDNHNKYQPSGHYNYTQKSSAKRNPVRSSNEVFMQSKNILKKSPQIRSPADNQIIFQLIEHNKFLADLVRNINIQCFKGIMKQAKIQEVRERQLLCEQGKPVTHVVVLLEGKLGVCKPQDDFLQGQNSISASQNLKYSQNQPSSNKNKQSKTTGQTSPMQNIFNQLSAISCKQIQNIISNKNPVLKRKSSIAITAGLFLPMPFSKQQFQQYEIQSHIQPGQEHGAKIRCKSKYHTNTCIAVQKSTLLIIQFNQIVYWFQHSFRAMLGQTILKLKKIPAFSFLDDGKLAECILFMKKQKKTRKQYFYRQGDKSDRLFILLNGAVKLSKEAKLFQQNPNQLYVNRQKLINQGASLKKHGQDNNKIQALTYANFTTLYNYRPIKKTIQIGVIACNNQNYNLIGQTELIQKRPRQTNAIVSSFDCQYYQIQIKKLEQILGSRLVEQFYGVMEKSLRKIILYRQNQYADKINMENKKNLDYFYYQNDKVKDSPRKYKLQKINNKFNGTDSNQLHVRSASRGNGNSNQDDQIKPFYTTFNFHKLIKTQRLSHARKSQTSGKKRKETQDSHDNIQMKFNAVQERLIGISHSWKPIKKKVMQQIKVMQKISPKRHSISINQPLIQQQYFHHVEKEQKRIDREHKVFKLSLGKRTKW